MQLSKLPELMEEVKSSVSKIEKRLESLENKSMNEAKQFQMKLNDRFDKDDDDPDNASDTPVLAPPASTIEELGALTSDKNLVRSAFLSIFLVKNYL